jgi:hypothetical protein
MGMILADNDQGLHAEAKTDSFCLFSDFGKDWSIELDWGQLSELRRLVGELTEYAERHGIKTFPTNQIGDGI